MDRLLTDYSNLSISDKNIFGRRATHGGKFTKGFLKYNKQQLKAGLTTTYAIKSKLYNPKTDRFVNIKYKKSGTRFNIETAKSKRRKRVGSVLVSDYIKHFVTPTEADINKPYFFRNIFKKYNLRGKWRFIFKSQGIVLREASINISGQNYNTMFKNPHQDLSDFVWKFLIESPVYLWFDHYYNGFFGDGTISVNPNRLYLYITQDFKISQNLIEQTFNNSKAGYCLIGEVYKWIENKICEAKTEPTRIKYISKQNKFLDKTDKKGNVKIGYFTKYKDGIPDKEIDSFANDLQIEIRVEKPFSKNTYIHSIPLKRRLRTFNFTNTQINHVEYNKDNEKNIFDNLYINNFDDVIVKDNFTEMNIIADELKKNKTPFICSKNMNGYSLIKTMTAIYSVNDDFNKTCREFEDYYGMDSKDSSWKYDAIENPDKNNFVNFGCHFNGTTDFINTNNFDTIEKIEKEKLNGLRHKDLMKAYTQFKKCKYYTGFMRAPEEFRKVNNYKRKGLYLIDNIDFSKCNNNKFIELNKKLRWYLNYNIYTDAELRALADFNIKFDVIAGVMGVRKDFEFPKSMFKEQEIHKLDDKKIKISYYAKWTGRCASQNLETSFYMNGDKEFFENLENDNANIWYNDMEKMALISYKKKSMRSLKHITAQITAYQRLIMLEQLLKMDINKLVRICVDGIYYYEHKCEFDKTLFADKDEKMTFNNSETENYLSNIFDRTVEHALKEDANKFNYLDIKELITLPKAEPREYYKKELHIGSGGTGKTTRNLLDSGLQDVLYIAPSWKLSTQMKNDMKNKFKKIISSSVLYRIINDPYKDNLLKYYKNIILDESSQYNEHIKNELFKLDFNRIIFVGDLGYQLPPVISKKEIKLGGDHIKEMTEKGIDNIIRYTEKDQRRFKCEKLKYLCNKLRKFIDEKRGTNYTMAFLLTICQTITKDKLKKIYKKEDIILTTENIIKEEYTEIFENNKFVVQENTSLYKNGEIIYNEINDLKIKKQHGFTIHSVQGETYLNNLFIDIRKQKSTRMIYTAISRAKRLNQIYLIVQ